MQTQAEVSYKKNLALVGQTRKALVDGIEDGKLYARLPSQAPEVDGVTHLSNGSKNLIGRFCNLKITGCDAYDLHASLEGK